MKCINESELFSLNSYLNDCLKKYIEEKDENVDKSPMKLSIRFATDDIIDKSNGFINTESENIKDLFTKLFEISINIKRYSQYLEHLKSEIRNCKNDDKLEDIATELSMTSALLKNVYNKAYKLTQEIKKISENTKKK